MPPAAEVPSVPALLDEAAARAGVDVDDWGGLGFLPALELLVESCRATARLNATGAEVLTKVVLRHLRNLLAVRAVVDADPDVADRALGSPIVITGLPRTGTTLVQNLLALDPAHRVLRVWEALRPVPVAPRTPSAEVRIGQAEAWLAKLYELAPGFEAIHGLSARGPEECDALLQNTFASQHFDDMFDARDYSAWLNSADLSEAYAFYRLQLQVLAGTGPAERRWVLKSPSHLGHLDALFEVLPGATVVHCHRHPLEAVPSYASLVTTIRRPYSDDVDPAVCGRQALERSALAMDRALAVRDSGRPEGTFVDVSYPALARDPIEVLASLYQHLGRPLGADVEAAMRDWLAEHPRHHQGVHRYRGADFGLVPDEVAAAFAGYLDRFGALVES
ncbi:MAG: sulfotransferase [Actinobacteria bacterium]|nr:sulfotransferase [Actinomycetota bacterium]